MRGRWITLLPSTSGRHLTCDVSVPKRNRHICSSMACDQCEVVGCEAASFDAVRPMNREVSE